MIFLAILIFVPVLVFGENYAPPIGDPPKPTEASPELRAEMIPPPGALGLFSYDDEIIIISVYIEEPATLTIKGKYIQLPAGDDNYDTTPSYSDPLRYAIPIRIDHNYDDEKFNVGVAQNGMFDFTKQLTIENKDKPFEVTLFHKAKWTKKVEPFFITFDMYPKIELVADEKSKAIPIPSWIKNNAEWWAAGQIDDESFVQGIQYLIKEEIIRIPETESNNSSGGEIPKWIKNNAGWWADGSIDDESFVQGIQYLVEQGIIQIN